MSTATKVPETWELTGDDARETLLQVGRWQLTKDAVTRFRRGDGSSHGRSMAFLLALVLFEGIIGLVGLAAILGNERFGLIVSGIVQDAVPGPAGETLSQAVGQAEQAATTGKWLGLVFGLVGALVTGTTLMAQVERSCNRLYGVERDRPGVERYTRAFVLTLTAGVAIALAFVLLAFGRTIADSANSEALETAWLVVRWPLGLGLLVAAMALLLRWSPNRRQPSWSWLAYGSTICVLGVAAASIGLGVFFRLSSSFGDTYGPLAGTVALLLWAQLVTLAVVFGVAVAAELEAVRSEHPRAADDSRSAELAGAH